MDEYLHIFLEVRSHKYGMYNVGKNLKAPDNNSLCLNIIEQQTHSLTTISAGRGFRYSL